MKKIAVLLFSLFIILSSCNFSKNPNTLKNNYNLKKLLLDVIDDEEKKYLIEIDEKYINDTLLTNSSDISEYYGYISSSYLSPETIIGLKIKDKANKETILNYCSNLILNYQVKYELLTINEYQELIKNSKILVKGNYIFIIISSDIDNIVNKINDNFY